MSNNNYFEPTDFMIRVGESGISIGQGLGSQAGLIGGREATNIVAPIANIAMPTVARLGLPVGQTKNKP